MMDWHAFWEAKASSDNDFQATGRGLMDVPGYLHTIAEVVRILNLKQGEKLADIGCGSGLIALSVAPWLDFIYGVDISKSLIKRATDNLKGFTNVSLQIGSLTNIPLENGTTDKLLAYSVLQYLKNETDVMQALNEINRVLRPGGRALLAANPDPVKRTNYEETVKRDTDQDAVNRNLALIDDLLWLSQEKLLNLAKEVGFSAKIEPISTKIWQHFYMFDLVLEKVR